MWIGITGKQAQTGVKQSVHWDSRSFMKWVMFIDLPCNPLSVSVVSDGGGKGNGESDGGRFLTGERDNRLALMGYWYSCSPVGFDYCIWAPVYWSRRSLL